MQSLQPFATRSILTMTRTQSRSWLIRLIARRLPTRFSARSGRPWARIDCRAIVLHIMNMAIGEFTAVSTQAERLTRDEEEIPVTAQIQDPRIKERQADLRAMDVALGLGHARSDTVNGVGPIISGDYSVILRDTFAPLASTTLNEFLKQVDPERLRTVTRDFSALTQSIAVASEEFRQDVGQGRVRIGSRGIGGQKRSKAAGPNGIDLDVGPGKEREKVS